MISSTLARVLPMGSVMLAKAIRAAATAVSLVVALALCLFAADQFAAARDSARADLGAVGVAGDVDGRENAKGWLREDVDAVAGALTAPFAWAGPGNEPWIAAGGPALVALAVYGFGGFTLARWLGQRLGTA